jgi:ABC-type transport system substrate-binding protein
MVTRGKRTSVGMGVALLAAVGAVLAIGAAGAGAEQQSPFALPRAQTLYMSGTAWSPYNDLNPAKNWDYATGVVGLAYETPFRYDPLKDTFIPWLATGGTWTSKTTYVMRIRTGREEGWPSR